VTTESEPRFAAQKSPNGSSRTQVSIFARNVPALSKAVQLLHKAIVGSDRKKLLTNADTIVTYYGPDILRQIVLLDEIRRTLNSAVKDAEPLLNPLRQERDSEKKTGVRDRTDPPGISPVESPEMPRAPFGAI